MDTAKQLNNSAARLLAILREMVNSNKSERVGGVWARMFNIQADSVHELLMIQASVFELALEARNAVLQVEGIDQGLFLEPFTEVESCFKTLNLQTPITVICEQINATTLKGLAHAAHELARSSEDDSLVAQADLDNLLASVEGVIKDLVDSDIDKILKADLLDSLEATRRAIIEYKIWGLAGLKRAFVQAAGTIAMYQGHIQDEAKKKPSVRGYIVEMDKLMKIVRYGERMLKLGKGAVNLYLSLTGDSPPTDIQ